VSCQRVIDERRVGRDVGSGRDDESCDIMRHHATSCDITRHHAIGSGSGSGAGGVRCHSTEGVAEESRGGGSGSGRRAGVGSGRGSPYSIKFRRVRVVGCPMEDRTQMPESIVSAVWHGLR